MSSRVTKRAVFQTLFLLALLVFSSFSRNQLSADPAPVTRGGVTEFRNSPSTSHWMIRPLNVPPDFAPCSKDTPSSTSSPSATVEVTVISVRAIDDFDPPYVFWDNPADFYGKVVIDGQSFDLPKIPDSDYASYDLNFSKVVDQQSIPIRIDIWDSDTGSADDHADISPVNSKDPLDISFNLCSFMVTGDIVADARQRMIVAGNGDDDRAEVIFTVGTQDHRPLSSDDLAITEVDMLQVIPEASVIIAEKPTILKVRVANNFQTAISTSIKITITSSPTGIVNFNQIYAISPALQQGEVRTLYYLLDNPLRPPSSHNYYLNITAEIDPDRVYRPPIGLKLDCRAVNDVAQNMTWKVVSTRTPSLLWSKAGMVADLVSGSFATDEELQKIKVFGDSFILGTYPLAALDVSTSPIPLIAPLSSIDWLLMILEAVTQLPARSLLPFLTVFELSEIGALLGYDRIMGVLEPGWFSQFDSPLTSDKWSKVEGLSLIEMAPHGVIFYPGQMTNPAHELGHTFGLSVDPAMKSWLSWETFPVFTPGAWDEYLKPSPYDFGNPATGFWIAQGGEPPELAPLLNKPVCGAHCFMGYSAVPLDTIDWASVGNTSWVDRADYEHLVAKLRTGSDPEVIHVSGFLKTDGTVFMTPWYRLANGTVDFDSGSRGNYSFVFLDGVGRQMSEVYFTPSFVAPEFPDPMPFGAFSFNLEFPAGTAKIQLWNKYQGVLLYERTVSANPPSVVLTLPLLDQVVKSGKTLHVAWDGTDKDGNSLTYTLALSQDGRRWFPITGLLDATQYEWNTTDLPAGRLLLKVIASDGINIAESQPVAFIVAASVPALPIPRQGQFLPLLVTLVALLRVIRAVRLRWSRQNYRSSDADLRRFCIRV